MREIRRLNERVPSSEGVKIDRVSFELTFECEEITIVILKSKNDQHKLACLVVRKLFEIP